MPKKRSKVDALLDQICKEAQGIKPGQKCRCCSLPVARDLIARYLERRDKGEQMPSLFYLATQIIRPRFGISYGSVRGHIRDCLKKT